MTLLLKRARIRRRSVAAIALTGACAWMLVQGAPAPVEEPPTRPGQPAPEATTAPPAAPAPTAGEHEITPSETEAVRAGAAAPAADAAAPAAPATSPADAAASPGKSAPTPASRSDAYAEFRRLFDDRQYEQALVPARQVVTLTEQEGSGDELQVAIMNLAATQSLAGNYSDAEASFLRVIALVEAEGTRASSRLARANAGLAVVYH